MLAHPLTRQQVFLPPHTECLTPGTPKQFHYGAMVNPEGHVENYWIDSQNRRVIGFTQGVYLDTGKCPTGSSGVDGTCVCPASANSPPFADDPVTSRLDREYWAPGPNVRNDLTEQARYLAAQRRPLRLGDKQPNLDGFYAASY